MKIKKLYSSDNSFFSEIEFLDGLNIILGEKSPISNKRNGVGKSLCVEFLNYCLLKDINHSRLNLIPNNINNYSKPIFLDIEINETSITIKRTLKDPNNITIYQGVNIHNFDNINDAKNHLLNQIKFKKPNTYLSFRDLINPLTRDERCEFKSIPQFWDTKLTIPINYLTHFFFLGLDNNSLKSAMTSKSRINSYTKNKTEKNKNIERVTGKKASEAQIESNRLRSEISTLNEYISNNDYNCFDNIETDELTQLNIELERIRNRISILRINIKKAGDLLLNDFKNDYEDVKNLYYKINKSLGDVISKTLDQAISFKKKINGYNNTVIQKNISIFNKQLLEMQDRRNYLIDRRDLLKTEKPLEPYNFKEIIEKIAIKKKNLDDLLLLLDQIKSIEKQIRLENISLEQNKIEIELQLEEKASLLSSFEDKIIKMHKYIFNNNSTSFKIEINNKKEIVNFNLRISQDGGHSNERAKVLIYDFTLLLHDIEYSNHLGFLVHDNIFDNDDDTIEKSLNFIEEILTSNQNKQYILTLNSDKLKNLSLNFNPTQYTIASFTKQRKFIKQDYQEIE
ncbi:DUF2326 domain-containing protein [Photobacterium carnosum]|uniref:DUF2326 domain-containing protein n=1 Tax=Photobacterium carnosum TaxID=2023717 RepID=UPI001E454BA2|nr:DUF2326 domain-containing protein [Photobacterium carnosum]MCD9523199.1 DUF2326 domain-containing protein [Photobacterium carnosum]